MRGPSPVVARGGHSSSRCAGLSLSRPLLLRSTGSRRVGSVVVAHGPSCSAACGILPDQGSNPCPLHWQADSQPLSHQGSPRANVLKSKSVVHKPPGPHPRLEPLRVEPEICSFIISFQDFNIDSCYSFSCNLYLTLSFKFSFSLCYIPGNYFRSIFKFGNSSVSKLDFNSFTELNHFSDYILNLKSCFFS